MFDTKTTDFDIMNTPYGKDITRKIIEAFRAQGIAIGLYYSPDDFHFLYERGKLISRKPAGEPVKNISKLTQNDERQLRELLTNYGKIDILFLDGPNQPYGAHSLTKDLARLAWKINPDIVITRGAMETPEISASTTQSLPRSKLPDVWEANFTMGTAWQYKPTNEHYRDGTVLIKDLIKTHAMNGNMLLDIGPKPNGEIAQKQKNLLREIGTWLFINSESIYNTKPWIVTNENNIWFTASENGNMIYAIITKPHWEWGTQKTIILHSVRATEQTTVQVLGQSGKVLEYHPNTTPRTHWENTDSGLRITAWRAQRIYNNRKWPNPVVIKVTYPKSVKP